MQYQYVNNARAILVAPLLSADIMATVDEGALFFFGARWDAPFVATITDPADPNGPPEIVHITGMFGGAGAPRMVDMVRAQEGTQAREWPQGGVIEARITAAILRSFLSADAAPVRLGLNSFADHSQGVAVGRDANAGGSATALGAGAVAQFGASATGLWTWASEGCVALGRDTAAVGTESVAIGPYSEVLGRRSIALGAMSGTARGGVLSTNKVPAASLPLERASDYFSLPPTDLRDQNFVALKNWLVTTPVELAAGVPWTVGAVYRHGDIIRPPTPNDTFYFVAAQRGGTADWNNPGAPITPPTFEITAAGEPTAWATTRGGSVWDSSGGSYVAFSRTTTEIMLPTETTFFPDECGFICTDYAGVTAAPFVSIGTAANPTLFVNNQQLTQVTGANTRHRFQGLSAGTENSLLFTLVTAATGTADSTFQGRFYVSGGAIERKGNA